MESEERRYIIYEKALNYKTFSAIAKEMGISKQAISNDRRRHKAEWEKEERWLDFKIKEGIDEALGEMITQAREDLIKVMSMIEEVDEQKQEALAAAAEMRPEKLVEILKGNEALKRALEKQERRLHMRLANLLAERHEQRY